MMRAGSAESTLHETVGMFNAQPEILAAIVKQRTGHKGHLGDLYIQIIKPEEQYVQIALRPPPSREEVVIKIPFDPPLASTWDVRGRMLRWRDEAKRKYAIPPYPPVTYFAQPPMFPYVAPAVGALAVLVYALVGKDAGSAWLREKSAEYLGPAFLKFAAWFAAFMHLLAEPAYMIYTTGQHRTPLAPRLKWILWNVAVGYGAIDEFAECVLHERLRHIYQQTDVGDIGPYLKDAVTEQKKTQ